MNTHFSKSIIWHSRRSLEQLGLPGVAGLALLAFCTMFYFSSLLPLGKEVRSLESEADAAQTQVRRTSGQRESMGSDSIDFRCSRR